MSNKKLTDNEIIKALECCVCEWDCDNCPYNNKCSDMHKDALDLINRQKAEIEKFKKIETTVNGFWEGIPKLAMFRDKEIPTLEETLEYVDNIKAEIIKEFAERLEKESFLYQDDECAFKVVAVGRIKNIAKEMTEEEKDDKK